MKKSESKAKKPTEQPASEPAHDQVAELTADLQRLQADFTNYKRREAELALTRHQTAQAELVKAFLPFIDNVERALKNVPQELESHEFVKGIQGVARQLQEILSKHGIERLQVVDQEFDPELMDAVAVEDGKGKHEVVTEELQSGYRMGESVIRHAMVKVKRTK